MELIIPGLPNDIAHQCLFRLPFSQIHCLRYVSRAWKYEINLSELFRLRKSAGIAQSLIILSQVDQFLVPRLVVFDHETGLSSDMPPLPDSNKLPHDSRSAVVGSEFIVMGGYDYKTESGLDSVFIFDFCSSTWGDGAKLPDGPRFPFSCAVYDNRTVFVAGGQRKQSFTSSWTYDVASNNWNQLPNMIKDSDGKWSLTGQCNKTLEIFGISPSLWSKLYDTFGYCVNIHCVEGFDQNRYNIDDYELRVHDDEKWKFVARLPTNSSDKRYKLTFLIASPGHILLVCASKYRENYEYDTFKMDFKDRNWIKGKLPIKLFSSIDSGYSLII